MTLVPVRLPPGVYKNGTPHDAKGRYADCNLVRWHDGSARAVGGWQRRTNNTGDVPPLTATPATETFRDCITFTDNSGLTYAAFGSNNTLTILSDTGVPTDVSPAGLPQQPNEVSNQSGYGTGLYGTGLYGVPRNFKDEFAVPVNRWWFDMWGQDLIACREDGNIYSYAPGAANAVVIPNAPDQVQAVIVTDERIVMAIRNTASDIRELVWSDRENREEWTPTNTNYASYRVLPGTGKLLGIYKTRGEYLVLSTNDATAVRYIGAPFVHSHRNVGTQCGPLHHKAVVANERFAMWLGDRNFWMYDGTLRPMECDVMDFLASDINKNMASKIWATTIGDYSELWWFYQCNNSTEGAAGVDSYVAYNYKTNHWQVGRLARTTGYDRGSYRSPIMLDTASVVQNHEQVGVIPTPVPYLETGPIELGEGNDNIAIRNIFPDTQSIGNVTFTIKTRQFPTDPDYTFGPFEYNNPTPTTGVRGREIRIRYDAMLSKWEIGSSMRMDIEPVQTKDGPTR